MVRVRFNDQPIQVRVEGAGLASLLVARALSAADAAEAAEAGAQLARDQAADLVLPQNIFIAADLATARSDGEAGTTDGTTFKAVGTTEKLAQVRMRTPSGSDLLYEEATLAAFNEPTGALLAGLASVERSPADDFPNASPFWWNTNPTSFGGKVYVSTCRPNNEVWLDVYDKPATGAQIWQQSYFLGRVGNYSDRDDHQAGGVAVRAGKPLVVFFSGHSYDNVVYYISTLKNIDDYLPGEELTFGEVQRLELAPNITTSYVIVLLRAGDDDIRLMHRTGSGADRWSLSTFPDWATGTPTTIEVFSSADQFYIMARVVGDTIRCAVADHPSIGTDNKVWYAEIDLTDGSVTESDGTVLGNLDGTNLPLAEASLELVYTAPGSEKPWIFDVGYGADPEIAMVSGTVGGFGTTGYYYYAKLVAGSWVVNDIVQVGSFLSGAYFPSITFDPEETGAVYLARETGGTTYISRYETADNGVNWTSEDIDIAVVASDTTLTRAFAVQPADGGTPIFAVMATEIDVYPTYDADWVSRFRPLPRALMVKRLPDVLDAVTLPARLILPPTTGLYLPGTSGAYVSAANASLGDLVDGLRLEVDVALDDWANGSTTQTLIAKHGSTSTRSVWLSVLTNGQIQLAWSEDGSAVEPAVASVLADTPAFENGERVELAVMFVPELDATHNKIIFQYRRHGDVLWTEISRFSSPASNTEIDDNASAWEIGSRTGGTVDLAAGTFYRAAVMTYGGEPVLEWRADYQGRSVKDGLGNTWVRNGSLGSVQYGKAYNATNPFRLDTETLFLGATDSSSTKDGRAARMKLGTPGDATDGQVVRSIRAKIIHTGNANITSRDDWVVQDAAGSITSTLPAISALTSLGLGAKEYEVTCVTAAGGNLAVSGSDTIDGGAGPLALAQGDTVLVKFHGTNWIVSGP